MPEALAASAVAQRVHSLRAMVERRRWPRIAVPGSSCHLVVNGDPVGGCYISDLSAGGARIEGALSLSTGEHVVVVLKLPGQLFAFHLSSRVVHVEQIANTQQVGVVFDNATERIQDTIQLAVLHARSLNTLDGSSDLEGAATP